MVLNPSNVCPSSSGQIIGTFSITFFVGNGTLQTAKCHVCSLQFMFEPQEGLPAVSDLWQGFLPQKVVQPRV